MKPLFIRCITFQTLNTFNKLFLKRIDRVFLQRAEEYKLILNEGGNFLKYPIQNCYKKLACSLQVTVLALQCYQTGRGNCFPNAFQICEHILMQKCCLSHQLLLVSSDQCKKCCIQKCSVAQKHRTGDYCRSLIKYSSDPMAVFCPPSCGFQLQMFI